MGLNVRGIISGYTGGIIGSGKGPQNAGGDYDQQWSPEYAAQDIINNRMGGGDLRNLALKSIGNLINNPGSSPALTGPNNAPESFAGPEGPESAF